MVKKTNKLLHDSYYKLLRHANDIIFITDKNGDIKFINQKAIQTYGYTEEEILNLNIKDFRADSQRITLENIKDRVSETGGYMVETFHKKKDGSVFPVEISVQIIEIDDGKFIQGFVRDITERKESEKKITQLNRVYAVLSNINQMIVRIKDKSILFSETCEIAVRDGGFKMAWIGIVDPLTRIINVVSNAGHTNDYLDNLKIDLNNPESLTGLAGKCISLGAYQVCNDVEKEPLTVRNVEAALKNNFLSIASFPLKIKEEVFGVINLYSDLINFFTQDEIKLLEEMAGDISYAVEFLNNESLKSITEKALRESYERYKELFENNPSPMWIYNTDNLRIIDVNKTAIYHYGYSRNEFLSMTLKDLRPAEDIPTLVRILSENENEIRHTNVVRHKKKDGSIFYVEIKSNVLPFNEQNNYRIVLANDITERLKAEEALKDSEERMRVIIEGTPHLFFYVQDAGASIKYISPSVEKITGYKTEQWLGNRSWFITGNEINKIAVEATHAHLRGDFRINPVALEVRHAEGHPILLEAYENPVIKDGKVVGLQGVAHDITEKSKAVHALRESEERFRLLYENFIVGLYRTTPDGKIILANSAMVKMLGYISFDELSSRNLEVDGYEPSYRRSSFIEAIERDGKVVDFESAWKKNDGTVIFVRETAQAIRDAGGKTLYYDGMVEDITEFVRASEEINKLSRAVEQSPVSIMITDTKGNLEYVNTKFCELTGYSREEVIGRNPRFLKSGYTNAEEYKKLWETISSGREWKGEFYDRKKDGTFVWESATISPIINAAGGITHYLALKENITERKKDEQLIIKSETEFRSVWESSKDAMRLCDENGIILRVNEAFCKLFERPENEFVGQLYQKAYKHEDNASQIFRENITSKNILTKQEAEVELWNGKKRWMDISNSIIEINNTVVVLSIFRDISERKAYEVELRLAKERAEEANKTKDLFLANMSHELRTPLIGILGYSDMLVESLKNSDEKEMAKGIKRSGFRLLKTLNLLLDLTRIEADKFELNIVEKDITEEIEFVYNMFKGAALEKKLRYSFEKQSSSLNAKVDPSLVTVILENLVNNAIKFTGAGSINIIAGKQGSDKIFIKVKDTGIGIDNKNFEKIFEEFRQVSEGINREFQGTGLGLAIAKRYTEIIGGTISLESALGTGTAFTLTFPAA